MKENIFDIPYYYLKPDGIYIDKLKNGVLKKCEDDHIVQIPAITDDGQEVYLTAKDYYIDNQ